MRCLSHITMRIASTRSCCFRREYNSRCVRILPLKRFTKVCWILFTRSVAVVVEVSRLEKSWDIGSIRLHRARTCTLVAEARDLEIDFITKMGVWKSRHPYLLTRLNGILNGLFCLCFPVFGCIFMLGVVDGCFVVMCDDLSFTSFCVWCCCVVLSLLIA